MSSIQVVCSKHSLSVVIHGIRGINGSEVDSDWSRSFVEIKIIQYRSRRIISVDHSNPL